MKPKTLPLSLLVFGCLVLVAAPALADAEAQPVAEEAASTEAVADDAPPACPALDAGLVEPLLQAPCSVSVECADGSMVSCTGDSSCSTSGTNGRCVTCDGVQEACCPKTCCENCEENLESCLRGCGNPVPSCDVCHNTYNFCVSNCTGGCP